MQDMRDAIVVLLAGGQGERLWPLTRDRAKPAVPFGALYRIIDITLSNCVNSGLRRVFVLTQYKALSLSRHVRAGWSGLAGLGEYIEILPPQMRVSKEWYRGTADAVYQNIYSIGSYMFNTQLLIPILIADAEDPKSHHDFGKDILPRIIARHRVFAYDFVDENSKTSLYWRDVGTIDAYYEANMDLVSVSPVFNLYDEAWPLRTWQHQYPPAKFVFGDPDRMGVAVDSIVAGGSVISGGRASKCVVGYNVRVNSYCDVSDSILYNHVNIGRHSKIRRAIIDRH